MMTVEDLTRAAFQALLRGDTAARDRYCAMAKALMEGRVENPMVPQKPIHIGEAKRVPPADPH